MPYELIETESEEAFVAKGASLFEEAITHALSQTGRCVLGLSGGMTPLPIYAALRERPIEWTNVWVFLTDERYVSPDHADSNLRALKESLLDPVGLPPEHLVAPDTWKPSGGPGDVLVLMCRGPMGSGMEEIFEITVALKYLDFGKHVAVITDARFSGVSTGACIGHVTPEALAGGPLGKIQEGDRIEIAIDRVKLEGSINVVNGGSAEEGSRILAARPLRGDLAPDPALPTETRLWAALQDVSGGTWGGCVFDTEAILKALQR